MLSIVTTAESEQAFYQATGALIRAARIARGLTQSELAGSVGLTRTSVVNIEKGRQKILLHTLRDFASALGSVPGDLLPPEAESGSGYGSRMVIDTVGLSRDAEQFVRLAMDKPRPTKKTTR